jgi:hypothetical protein
VLPGLATAFSEAAMREYLQAALFGDRSRYTVERCTPTRPLYMPGECCVLRYDFQARDNATGEVVTPIVTGRVFPNESVCAAYMREKLGPLAARMHGRPEVAAFSAPAAAIEPLHMVVHVWPIDGELPTLVDATDRVRMLEIFEETLPFAVEDCRIELVSYRRRQRCVLRYTIDGGHAERAVVYGKVTGIGNETLASPLIETLRDRVGSSVTVPRLLAWRPELQLALLEALPGEPHTRRAVKARLRGKPRPDVPQLEEMMDACARAAAALHTSGIELGPLRAFENELAALEREVASARHFVPGFADRARSWLEAIAVLAARSEPLELCLNHGDFNHGQLIFDGATAALLDLDTLCQAEPSLDLGKFLAHLRAETEKLRRREDVSSTLGGELAERFLGSYVRAVDYDADRLRSRTMLYEAMALIRLAVRSQHDFEETRLDIATSLLDERMAAIDDRS